MSAKTISTRHDERKDDEDDDSRKQRFQPRVTTVETRPSAKANGCISIPEGSIWCNGNPTLWWVGHDNSPEQPVCQVTLTDDETGETTHEWKKLGIATLELSDPRDPHAKWIDRHDCVVIDNNGDGIPDLTCVVGADSGMGEGYNEVYVTQPDGSLHKLPDGHGFLKYKTLRTRMIRKLRHWKTQEPLVYIATDHGLREDGRTNTHKLFHLNQTQPTPYYTEIKGPFNRNLDTNCVVVADINQDGIDDLIVCGRAWYGHFFLQQSEPSSDESSSDPHDATDVSEGTSQKEKDKDKWTMLRLNSVPLKMGVTWLNVRVADMTGDGVSDLIVVGCTLGKKMATATACPLSAVVRTGLSRQQGPSTVV